MGTWAKAHFGKEKFEDVGIVIAGTSKPEYEQQILGLFDDVLSMKDMAFHTYLVSKNGKQYPVVFNIYGAPAMMDALAVMHDGGCRTVLFVGYAYGGFQNSAVGSIVLPTKSYHFEGIYSKIDPEKEFSVPDEMLLKKVEEVFQGAGTPYIEGINISVPSVTFQPPHANDEYRRIRPTTVEMELSACYARANDIAMRAAGILIVSDNKAHSIGDTRDLKNITKVKVIETIIQNLDRFHLPALPREKEFSIDAHLASIIDDPDDRTNVYQGR